MTLIEYAKTHTDKQFAEAIILEDGDIEETNGNYINALLNTTNKQLSDINIPEGANKTAILVETTRCILLEPDYCYLPEHMSDWQQETLFLLMIKGLINSKYTGYLLHESQKYSDNGIVRDIKPQTHTWTLLERKINNG